MRKFLTVMALCSLVAFLAYAEAPAVGIIRAGAVTSCAHNLMNDAGTNNFHLPGRARMTVQDDQNSFHVCAGKTCDAGVGLYVPAGVAVTVVTSVPLTQAGVTNAQDGGCTGDGARLADAGCPIIASGFLTVCPASPSTTANVKVMPLYGNE